jgi:hypothetical protein
LRNRRLLEGWGFLCNPDDDGQETNQFFKLNLDPMYKCPAGDPTYKEACKWYRDYLASIREHTLGFLEDSFGQFELKCVEFVFSVPTVSDSYRDHSVVANANKTWRDPRLIGQIEEQIKLAGFGRTPNERAHITLTEAEAAAVCALGHCMNEGQSFVVCDAGGGTTDVNALKVKSTSLMELEALSYTEGTAVGSTVIDFRVRTLIQGRLKHLERLINGDLETVIDRVIRNSFVSHKCNFGAKGYDVPKYMLPVPELPPGLDDPEFGIEDSRIVITRYVDKKRRCYPGTDPLTSMQ